MGPPGDLTWNDPIELLSIKTYHAREGFFWLDEPKLHI